MNIDLLIRNLKSSLSLLFLAFFAISPSIQAEIEELEKDIQKLMTEI
jgi:hypothetical protein